MLGVACLPHFTIYYGLILKHSDKHGLSVFPLFISSLFIIQGTGALLNGVGAAVSQRILQEQLQQHHQCQQ